MEIEQIKQRVIEVQRLANEILASPEAKHLRGYMMSTFVRFTIDADGDECYQIIIDECAPTDYAVHAFLGERLLEKGVTETIEITSEW